MKRFLLMAGAALACASLSACVSTSTETGTEITQVSIDPAKADAAAVKFEKAVGVVADTLSVAAADPNSGLDLKQLAADVTKAKGYLDQGRAGFDARTGDVTQLATQALDLISAGLPPTASPKVRSVLLAARLAVGLYGAEIGSSGAAAVPPSDTLVNARKSADTAVATLLRILPPPGGT